MNIVDAAVPDIKLIHLTRHTDHRGFFSETYNEHDLVEAGINCSFVQDNHSMSRDVGVVRGLHFQTPPHAQNKLIRVTRGRIFDVAVDIRWGSPTFGQHVAVELSAETWNEVFIPVGFAHGFCTLEPNTEVLYKVSSYYAPANDRGLLWNDAGLAINWPVDLNAALLSEKDKRWPQLSQLEHFFTYTPVSEAGFQQRTAHLEGRAG